MGMVASWIKPTNAGEMARIVESFFTDTFGMAAGGGSGPDGGELMYDLDHDDVSVVVLPADQAVALRRGADRIINGCRLDWLDADELKLIEAYRAGKRADEHLVVSEGDGEGPGECEFYFTIGGKEMVVETFRGRRSEWEEKAAKIESPPDEWSVMQVDGGLVLACHIGLEVAEPSIA